MDWKCNKEFLIRDQHGISLLIKVNKMKTLLQIIIQLILRSQWKKPKDQDNSQLWIVDLKEDPLLEMEWLNSCKIEKSHKMTTKELMNGCKKRMSLEMVLEFQLHTLYKCLIAKKEFPFKDRFNINKMIQLNISSLLIHWNCQEAKNLNYISKTSLKKPV